MDAPVATYLPQLDGSPAGAATMQGARHPHGRVRRVRRRNPASRRLDGAAGPELLHRRQHPDDRGSQEPDAEQPRPATRTPPWVSAIAGQAVAAAAHLSYPDLMRTRLFEPLGMSAPPSRSSTHSSPVADRESGLPVQPWVMDAYAPGGAAVSTTGDLAKLATALLDGTAPGMAALEPTTATDQSNTPDRQLLAHLHLGRPVRPSPTTPGRPAATPPTSASTAPDTRPSSSCPTSPTTAATSAASCSPTARRERHEQHRHPVGAGTRAGRRRRPAAEPWPPRLDRGRLVGHRNPRRPPPRPPPRSSRRKRAPSPAPSCVGSRWAGRCWPCSRCGSPTSHNGGPRPRPFMGVMGVAAPSGVRRAGACGARLGVATRPPGPRRVDGSCGSGAGCVAEASRWLLYPVLAVLGGRIDRRRLPDRERVARRERPIRRRASWSTSVDTGCICTAPAPAAPPSSWNPVTAHPRLTWVDRAGIARDSQVCVYDRAGRGWSDAAEAPQDAVQIAADLHTLLDRAHVPGPYVLAGHSFGGLYVLTFAAQYPDRVAGMVLLDSTAPRPGPSPPTDTQNPSASLVDSLAGVSAVAHLGVARLIAQADSGTSAAARAGRGGANASTARHLD